MKKLFQAIFIVLITATGVVRAQSRDQQHNQDRIHVAKMSYLQDRLRLPRDRYRDFVPVYEQYESEIRDTRRSFFGKYKGMNPANADDATSRQLVDDNLDYQQAVIVIKRKYNDRFLRILNTQQLADMYTAEREFKLMLVQRLKGRRPTQRFGR